MKHLSLISLGILTNLPLTKAQVISSKKWTDLFPTIIINVLVTKKNNRNMIDAIENGIFYYTIATGEITKLSNANSLHNIGITTFDYNPQTKFRLIDYGNRSLNIITSNKIKYIVDILISIGYCGVAENARSLGKECNKAITFSKKYLEKTFLSRIKDESKNPFKLSCSQVNYAYNINLFDNNQLVVSSAARANNKPLFIQPQKPLFYYFNGIKSIYPSFFNKNKSNRPVFINVLDAIINPYNSNEVIFFNYTMLENGIYKMKYNVINKDFERVKFYNLETTPYYRSLVGFGIDNLNNMFVSFEFNNSRSLIGIYDKASDDFPYQKR